MKRSGRRRAPRIADPLAPDLNKATAGSVRRSLYLAGMMSGGDERPET
jgi:hypothetical protein